MRWIGRWWRRRSLLEQQLLVSGSGVVLGVIGAFTFERRREKLPSGGFTPYEELPDLLDYESDEVDEEPPEGIEYDEFDAPCVGPDVEGFSATGEFCTPPAELEPQQKLPVAFAVGGDRPYWPVDTGAKRKIQVSYQDVRGKWHGRWGRHFGASRKKKGGGKRRHAGIDLFGDVGDEVVATEPGTIYAILPFYKGTSAVYVLTDSGLVVNYGELDKGSWRQYGLFTGKRIKAGDPLGRVGLSDDGSHMLHLETYDPSVTVQQIRDGDMQWDAESDPPDGLLDPSRYLVRAQRVRYEQMVENV